MCSQPVLSQTMHQVIHIEPLAAAKPAFGAPCNGCGVCCLAEPCPLGVLVSRSRLGPCKALRWNAELAQYRCGVLLAAGLRRRGQGGWRPLGLGNALAEMRERLVRRWIAAGSGCDSTLEAVASRTINTPSPNPSDAFHD